MARGNVRETSIEAYRYLNDTGFYTRKYLEIYNILFESGPFTANEILREITLTHRVKRIAHHNIHTMLHLLERARAVKKVGQKKDPISGRRVYLWDVTGEIPMAIVKRKGESRQKRLERMQIMVDVLVRHLEYPMKLKRSGKTDELTTDKGDKWLQSCRRIISRINELRESTDEQRH